MVESGIRTWGEEATAEDRRSRGEFEFPRSRIPRSQWTINQGMFYITAYKYPQLTLWSEPMLSPHSTGTLWRAWPKDSPCIVASSSSSADGILDPSSPYIPNPSVKSTRTGANGTHSICPSRPRTSPSPLQAPTEFPMSSYTLAEQTSYHEQQASTEPPRL